MKAKTRTREQAMRANQAIVLANMLISAILECETAMLAAKYDIDCTRDYRQDAR